MQRIHSPGAHPDHLFTEGSPDLGILPTRMTSDWLNSIQEELAQPIEHAGIPLDQTQKTNHTQLLESILHIRQVNPTWLRFDLPAERFNEPRETGIRLDSTLTRVADLQGVFISAIRPDPRLGYAPLRAAFYFCEREARWTSQVYQPRLDFGSSSFEDPVVLSISEAGHVLYSKPWNSEAGTLILTHFQEYPR